MTYDTWKLGGNPSRHNLLVTCTACEETTQVVRHDEYSTSDYVPAECAHCGVGFDEDSHWEDGDL